MFGAWELALQAPPISPEDQAKGSPLSLGKGVWLLENGQRFTGNRAGPSSGGHPETLALESLGYLGCRSVF